MFYQLYQTNLDLGVPLRLFSQSALTWLQPLLSGGVESFLPRITAAALEMAAEPVTTHTRPDFGISSVMVGADEVPIVEEVVDRTPFCNLLHFRKAGARQQPRLLIISPMSGHFATLLRGTVRTLLADHDVYITDWQNARDIPLSAGPFDFDDNILHIIRFVEHLGPGTHLLAVCQPAVPALAAVALMAARGSPAQPPSMTLMGGPIDPRAAPTQVSELARTRPLSWFEHNVVHTVPWRHAGAFRRVYPGFLQLIAFVAMNPDRHVQAHLEQFNNLMKGADDSVEAHRAFYREYTAVMDLPAEFYLQTLRAVFQDHTLARGTMVCRGEPVDPAAISRTALFTIEGELDDICAPGQTLAAQDLCAGLPEGMRHNWLQQGAGHYGIFNGRRWRDQVYPRMRDFIAAYEPA
jgi:poly(3-hydroxybutyrate) depolymerase